MERRRFETRHGRKLLLGGAREVTAAPGAAGLHAAWKRTTSPASIVQVPLPAGALLTDAGSSSLRRHPASASLVAAAGSSGSIDAGCSEERPSGRRQAERRGPRPLSRRYQPHILDPTLGSGPTGGRYFIYRPPPDGSRSAVPSGGRPGRRHGSTAAPPRRPVSRAYNCSRRVPDCQGHGAVVGWLRRIDGVDTVAAARAVGRTDDGCSGGALVDALHRCVR